MKYIFVNFVVKLIVMSIEIERKFLVTNDSYRAMSTCVCNIKQYYLSTAPERTVRVRVKDDRAYLTVKGVTHGATRGEWEYEIPVEDARRMIELCDGVGVSKRRFIVPFGNHRWEVDEFEGRHDGLVLAEIELACEDEAFEVPEFVGEEVTGQPQYYNSSLAGLK